MYARIYWTKLQRFTALSSIFLLTFLLTAYHLFEWDCQLMNFCNYTQVLVFCYSAATVGKRHSREVASVWRRYYIRISTFGNAIFVVFVPIVAVSILTILLIRQLHLTDSIVLNGSTRRSVSTQQAQRKRGARTVIVIASFFAVTQTPSAVICIWELLAGYSSSSNSLIIYKALSVANALVICGKTINFMLLCASSFHYRQRCFALYFKKFPTVSQSY